MTKHKPELPKHRHRNWFKGLHNWVGGWLHTYHPFYDEHADYNTNAKSYYDYLARHSKALAVMTGFINRLLDRNIELHETDTVTFTKKGDWIDNGECEPDHYDDVIDITADVKVSDMVTHYNFPEIIGKIESVKNAITVYPEGLYSPDYFTTLQRIDKILKKHDNEIKELQVKVDDLEVKTDSLAGLGLKRLTKGKDYDLIFYNDFSTPSNDLIIEVAETSTTLDLHVNSNSRDGHILKNPTIVSSALMSHTPRDEYDDKCRVFSIVLKGDYAKYTNSPQSEIIVDQSKAVLWNIAPVVERMSYDALLTPHIKKDKNQPRIELNWRSFSDGYNSQLSIHKKPDVYLDFGNVHTLVTLKKPQ